MPDPYLPTLETCAFTEAEQAVIAAALDTQKSWNWQPGIDDAGYPPHRGENKDP